MSKKGYSVFLAHSESDQRKRANMSSGSQPFSAFYTKRDQSNFVPCTSIDEV
jgi:hypothetical protein